MKRACLMTYIILFILVFIHNNRENNLFALSKEGGKTKLEYITLASPGGPTMASMVFLMGIEQGIYAKEGYNVDFVSMKGAIIHVAQVGGGLDYAGSASGTLRAAATGMPLKLIFTVATKRPTYIITKPTIKSLKDLKGKSIGVGSVGGSEHAAAKIVVSQAGLDPDKDLFFLGMGPILKFQSLISGSIDGIFGTDDEVFKAKKKGFIVLARASDYDAPLSQGLGVTDKKIKENPRQVKGILKGTLKAQVWTASHKKEVTDFMVKEWGLEREAALNSYTEHMLYHTKDGIIPDELVQKEIERAKVGGMNVKPGITPKQIVDYTLLYEVKKELGL